MHTGYVFGERAILSDRPPARLPATVILPAGQIRPRDGAPTVASPPSPSGEVWLPGPDDTVRGRVEHAVCPAAERRTAEAAQAIGVHLTAQDQVDIPAAERLARPDQDELRYAAASLDLGAWRCKVDNCPPGPRLAALLTQRPEELKPAPGKGAVLGAEFDAVPGGAQPADAAWPDAVLATVAARARLIAHLQAQQYADVAELSGCYLGIHQFLATELALALRTTDSDGAALLGDAEALRDRLPGTRAALASGDIDDAKAVALVRGTAACTPQVARAVESAVLPGAGSVTASTVRRRTTRAVIAADPDGAADRHRRERKERHVYRRPEDEGMGRLGVYAPAQDIATIWEAVTAIADAIRGPGDTRTLGQRRTDALVMICSDILNSGGWSGLKLPDKGLARPRINVTVPYTVLLGHRAPCELAGHGPIATEQALPLIGTGDLYRMICDPIDGRLLDYGRERYKPPPHLAEFVRMRDGECPMPSCHQPASRGQLDHIVPAKPDPVTGRPTHGTTCADNLGPPCDHHHLGKDAGRGFTLHRSADGTYTWTTPLGRVYTWQPEPLWHPDTDQPPNAASGGSEGNHVGGHGRPSPCACLPSTGHGNNDAGIGAAGTGREPVDDAPRDDTADTEDGSTGNARPTADTPAGTDDGGTGIARPTADTPADTDDGGTGIARPTADTDDDSTEDAAARGHGHRTGDSPADDDAGNDGARNDRARGPMHSDVPVCDCSESCPCQHGPEPDPHDLLEPLTVDGNGTDWADGFHTGTHRGADRGARRRHDPADAAEGPAPAGTGERPDPANDGPAGDGPAGDGPADDDGTGTAGPVADAGTGTASPGPDRPGPADDPPPF